MEKNSNHQQENFNGLDSMRMYCPERPVYPSGIDCIFDLISQLTKGGLLYPRKIENARIYEPMSFDNVRKPIAGMVNR